MEWWTRREFYRGINSLFYKKITTELIMNN